MEVITEYTVKNNTTVEYDDDLLKVMGQILISSKSGEKSTLVYNQLSFKNQKVLKEFGYTVYNYPLQKVKEGSPYHIIMW